MCHLIKDENEKLSVNLKRITIVDDRLMVVVMVVLFLLMFLKVWSILSLHITFLVNPTFLSTIKILYDPLSFNLIVMSLIAFNLLTKIRSLEKKFIWLTLLLSYLLTYNSTVGLLLLWW